MEGGGGGGRTSSWRRWRAEEEVAGLAEEDDDSRFQIRGIFVLLLVFTWSEKNPSDNYFGTEGVALRRCVTKNNYYTYFSAKKKRSEEHTSELQSR